MSADRFERIYHDILSARTLSKYRRVWKSPKKGREDELVANFLDLKQKVFSVKNFELHDVQIFGAMTLGDGHIAQMNTGEGKTITVAVAAAAYARNNPDRQVHVITSNDYLAKRDMESMSPLFDLCSITAGLTSPDMSREEKKKVYRNSRVIYGTAQEFAFDYMKNCLASSKEEMVDFRHDYCIIDEIDSILIDDAKTPLIISAPQSSNEAAIMKNLKTIVSRIIAEDEDSDCFELDRKDNFTEFTEKGYGLLEDMLRNTGLFAISGNFRESHEYRKIISAAHSMLQAMTLYQKDKDYVVKDGKVEIIDVSRGRIMEGRRWSNGLHEAVEAKENIRIKQRSKTLMSMTYPGFFNMYSMKSGTSGTVMTDAKELMEMYALRCVEIPPHKPNIRINREDVIFRTRKGKLVAAKNIIKEMHAMRRPVLVGTESLAESELLSKMLENEGIPHNVLNASQDSSEAHIIAQAGLPGAITVSTNMAGRGTDIILGGENGEHREEVALNGGLMVLSTQRNLTKRSDLQLAGRSARQGDPGEVQFLASLEDELIHVFSIKKEGFFKKLVADDSGIKSRLVTKAIDLAQEKFEEIGFAQRKNLSKTEKIIKTAVDSIIAQKNTLFEDNEEYLSIYRDALKKVTASTIHEKIEKEHDVITDGHEKITEALNQATGTVFPVIQWMNIKYEDMTVDEMIEETDRFIDEKVFTVLEKTKIRKSMIASYNEMISYINDAAEEIREMSSYQATVGKNPEVYLSLELGKLMNSAADILAPMIISNIDRQEVDDAIARGQDIDQDRMSGDQKVAMHLLRKWVRRGEVCPCGSGDRFKNCHGVIQ